jgi:hypothetical protein
MERKYTLGFLGNSTRIVMAFLVLLIFSSCNKEEDKVSPTTTSADLDPLISYLESTGFDRKNIVYKDGNFIIEGDIVISKEEVENYVNGQSSKPNQRTDHYRGYLVSNTYVTNIKYYINSTVPADWKTAIRGAISQWNAINGTKLYLTEVTSSSSANTTITTGYEDTNWVARAYLPSYYGKPGYLMTINTKYNYLSSGYKLFTIVHEMGHTFGLYHTDQTQGTFITGTPTSDPNSVMNSYILPWNGFTAGDQKAIQIMYPQ